MKFRPAPVDENFDLMHMVSEDGTWELGYVPMIFGVRIRIGRVGAFGPCVDYCCGASPDFRDKALLACLAILSDCAPTTEREMQAIFPEPEIKPIFNDPVWPYLMKQAQAKFPALEPILKSA